MLIAGEASGDMLAAELVRALRCAIPAARPISTADYQPLHGSLEPRFFGAGGPQMAAAGVDLAFDMTAHSVIGLSEALKNYLKFRRLFCQLFQLALNRQPDAIICVDFSGFNRRFAHAIRQYTRARADWFHDWHPKIIQYVSPQVWASREGRAYQMARDYDLILSIFPFEKAWYAKRVPQLRVEFVGHPIAERYGPARRDRGERQGDKGTPMALLLPGSRPDELRRHLPVMLGALGLIHAKVPNLRARMVLPNEGFIQQARTFKLPASLAMQAGGLPGALAEADVALASTGTVTTECAYFGVPTVALYKTSWSTWQIGRRIVKVKYAAMPNLLANEEIFPEFIQDAATPENLARAALDLLGNEGRRAKVKARLAEVIATLGGPGAPQRAASATVATLKAKAS
jgi:lipid-A-disaccharide synthase